MQVVGVGGNRAWRYDSAAGLPLTDLGTLKSDDSGSAEARDINGLGEVVGWADAERSKGNDQTFAFRIVGGVMESLGSLSSDRTWNDSEASAINILGDVVGSSLFAYPESRPFLYSDEFGMVRSKGFEYQRCRSGYQPTSTTPARSAVRESKLERLQTAPRTS